MTTFVERINKIIEKIDKGQDYRLDLLKLLDDIASIKVDSKTAIAISVLVSALYNLAMSNIIDAKFVKDNLILLRDVIANKVIKEL